MLGAAGHQSDTDADTRSLSGLSGLQALRCLQRDEARIVLHKAWRERSDDTINGATGDVDR